MEQIIGILASLLISCLLTIPWVNAIDKQMNDPEWQEHKDDPDYWEWP